MVAFGTRKNAGVFPGISRVEFRQIYRGFVFTDVSTRTDSGHYRGCVAITSLDDTRTKSQRFIDLEVFATQAAAIERIAAVAQAWIDNETGKDTLALPTNFSEF